VYYGDGGGKARAVAASLQGRDRVARFLAGLFRRIRRLEATIRIVEANGQPGAVTYDRDGRVVNVFALDIADGEVQAIRCVVNPDKLRHLGQVSELALELPPETATGLAEPDDRRPLAREHRAGKEGTGKTRTRPSRCRRRRAGERAAVWLPAHGR